MRNSIAIPLGRPTRARQKSLQLRELKSGVLGKRRETPHLGRKLYHLASGLVCVSLYAFVFTRTEALIILSVVGGIWIGLDLMRLKVPALNALSMRWFGKLMRREELKSVSANSFYILGLFVVVLVFPKPIAILSALYLAVGDPIAAIVGTRYGRHKLVGKKTVEGALGNFVACFAVTFLVAATYFALPLLSSFGLAVVGGAIAVLVEMCPSPIDDNLTIPVGSGILLAAGLTLLPLL